MSKGVLKKKLPGSRVKNHTLYKQANNKFYKKYKGTV